MTTSAPDPTSIFTGPDGSLRSNRAFCQTAGLYACDMFIGSTLQIDLQGNSSTVTTSRIAGFGGAPNMGADAARTPPPERALAAGRRGSRSRRPGAAAPRPQAGGADRRDLRREERAAVRREARCARARREAEARSRAGDDLRRRRHAHRHRGRHRQPPALPRRRTSASRRSAASPATPTSAARAIASMVAAACASAA